jgi:dolichol-phosphate mannosyltransferase
MEYLGTLWIILPIYNEVETIRGLIEQIQKVCTSRSIAYYVVCVDDGSRDGTAEVLADLQALHPLRIVTHRRNRGLGETIRDGLEAASDLAADNDVLVRMDADSTHEPKYIPSLIEAIAAGADVAIASRFAVGGGEMGLDMERKWISRLANLLFRTLFPLGGIREYTCAYRAYRAGLIKRALDIYGNDFIQLRGLGFCCTVEKLVKLKLLGARLVEVPFVLRYDYKRGSSKMVFSVTAFGYLVMSVLYHWPRSGWRSAVRRRLKTGTA